MTVNVVLCTCGDTLNEKLDFRALEEYAKTLDINNVLTTKALCTTGNKSRIVAELDGDRLVTLACTRSICQLPIEAIMEEAGIDKDQLSIVNSKEQIANVHRNRLAATGKAKMMLKAAITKVKHSAPLDVVSYERDQDALVVGGGIAGLTAASELADQGYRVHVIERSLAIGGAMSLISKTFPEEDCTLCLRGPGIIEMMTKPGIEYHINS
jgi:heterodisulfide reductase subunit A